MPEVEAQLLHFFVVSLLTELNLISLETKTKIPHTKLRGHQYSHTDLEMKTTSNRPEIFFDKQALRLSPETFKSFQILSGAAM